MAKLDTTLTVKIVTTVDFPRGWLYLHLASVVGHIVVVARLAPLVVTLSVIVFHIFWLSWLWLVLSWRPISRDQTSTTSDRLAQTTGDAK